MAGTYRVIAQSDLGNTVTSIVLEGTNLVVAPDGSGIPPAPGSTITVTDWTKNEAEVPAGPSTTAFYLSTDPVLDAGRHVAGQPRRPRPGPGRDEHGVDLADPARQRRSARSTSSPRRIRQNAVPEYDKSNNTDAIAIPRASI